MDLHCYVCFSSCQFDGSKVIGDREREWFKLCFCALFAHFLRYELVTKFLEHLPCSGFKGPTRTHQSHGALRKNSHLTNPNQFEHVALKSISQLSRRVKSKNNSKLKKQGKKERYAQRFKVRTQNSVTNKGRGSNKRYNGWFRLELGGTILSS